MSDKQENRKRRIAWSISIGLHLVLLLVFIFMIAWREPNPPYPEYGIEVNFGLEEVGSGDVQPTIPVNDTENIEEAQPEEQAEQEQVEETEAEEESMEESTVNDNTQVIEQPTESPDVIEKKEEVKETPKSKEEKKEVIKEKPKEVKKPVLYEKKDGADGKEGESSIAQHANHGDNTDQVGDKGNEKGTLDARTLYGNQGGGDGGPALNITGWFWDNVPNKKDPSSENGKIVFKFEINDDGEVVSVSPSEFNVSPKVLNFYKEQLLLTTFSPTDPNATPLPRTTGTVTFIIKSK